MQNTVKSTTSTVTFRTEAFTFVLPFRLSEIVCKFALTCRLGLYALGISALLRLNDDRAHDTVRQQLIGIRRNIYVADVANLGCFGASVIESSADVCHISGGPLGRVAHRDNCPVNLRIAPHVYNSPYYRPGEHVVLTLLRVGVAEVTLKCGARMVASCVADVLSNVAWPVK